MVTETIADRRLHPGTIWLNFISSVLGPWLVPALVFAGVNLGRPDGLVRVLRWTPAALMLILIGGGLTVLFSWVSWTRFRYGVGEREIVIESGVFTRVRRSIPLERVQDVSIEQRFLQRLFKLAVVKVETGGGKADEGLLNCVSMAEAERIRHEIRAYGAKAPEVQAKADASPAQPSEITAVPAGEKVFSMSLGRVLLSGLFGFSLFYLAAAFAVVETLGDLIAFDPFSPRTWRRFASAATFSSLAWLVTAVAFFGVVFGAGRVLFRDYGFTLWKEGRRLRRESGLFTRSQVVVTLPRVQLAKVWSSAPKRLFGWFAAGLQTLGDTGEGSSARQPIAPFARRGEVAAILAQAGPFRLPDPSELNRVSSRRLVAKLAPMLAPLTITTIIALFIPFAWWIVGAIGAYSIHAALEWRFHRYALADDLLFVTRGIWTQKVWIAPRTCGQTIGLRRSLLQRMLGLASLYIDTAGAGGMDGLEIGDLREAKARALMEELRRSMREDRRRPRRRAPGPKAQP